jgi:Protein of unknown function (DUF4013)
MDFGKAFTYAFDDADWVKKLGIAGLLMIIPIIGWLAVAGWGVEVARRVIQHDPKPLPDWGNFGDYLMKGVMVWVIGFVYALPLLLVNGCSQGLILALQNNNDNTLATGIAALSICISCVTFIYSILMWFVIPAAFGKYAATGQLGSAFRLGEVFGMVRAAPSAYLIALLGSIVAGFIGALGLIVCLIGALFTYAYSMIVQAHLWGQAYNVANPGQAAVTTTY